MLVRVPSFQKVPYRITQQSRKGEGIMKSYYWKFPSDAYAIGPSKAKSKKESKEFARHWAGCKRLPNGFQIWEA